MKASVYTQFFHEVDTKCELCATAPSLTDPEAEVYTVAELLSRHEKGLLTNMNIGKHAAYPVAASLDDRDLEKDFGLEPTDKFHLANEMESDPVYLDALKRKHEADEKARIEAAEVAFQAEAAKRGYKRGDEGGAVAST